MENDINTIIELIKSTYGAAAGGALAAISVCIYGLVKVIRLQLIQSLLTRISPKLAWTNWPKWAAILFVFVMTALGSFLSALALGTAWLPALIAAISAAIPVALGAMGIDSAMSSLMPKPIVNDKPNP